MELPEFSIIEHRDAKIPQLRFKVGNFFERNATYPAFTDGGHLTHHYQSPDRVTCFRVLGFGETEEAATKMALKSKKVLQFKK